ncbi:MAG: hypothetical protein Q4B28_08635 [bacterium]|nr:hypothetical protein [bacterium]
MEQALFAQLTSTKTMMEKTLISSRKKQLEKEYHLYLLLINELGWSEKLADEDRDILSIKQKNLCSNSVTSKKKGKKSDTQSQFIS